MSFNQTKQQRANVLEAIKMWKTVPEKNVIRSLYRWRGESDIPMAPDCGTLACFGGWACWWPAFRAQGVSQDTWGAPVASSGEIADEFLFGDKNAFEVRGYHKADHGFHGSDHALVMNRLQWMLDNGVVTEA